jgi:hypothetical protein
MTSSPIEARLRGFRRRCRQVLGLHGAACVFAVAFGIAVASGLGDWLLDLSTGVRAILLATLVVGTTWTAYRFLLVPLLFPLRDVDLALRVEDKFPELNDQLASAVEFMRESPESDRTGSPTLRREVVEHAARQAAALPFESAIDWKPARRVVAAAGSILLLAAALVLASPGSARTALARLINPFGDVTWPRDIRLRLLDVPRRIARGDAFQVSVAVESVGGRIPDRAEIHYEFDGGDTATEPMRPQGESQFTGGLEAVTRGFDFYIRAGDGLIDPVHVDVVPPPEIEGLRVRLTYPAYTGRPHEELPPDKGQVRAVWGTVVDLAARSSKPLARAELRLEPTGTIPAAVSPQGTELAASFKLEESGSYWFALRDREGFENRRVSRYELVVQKDQPPDVTIEQPSSDIEVTPTADVPLRVAIKDDFWIHSATLEHSASGSAAESKSVPLWAGDSRPQRHVVEHVWHLADLALTPGSSVTYRAAARDGDDLRGPNIGQSRQLRLMIVTPEALARRIEDRQLVIYQELERIRKQQIDAKAQVSGLNEQLARATDFGKADVARLQSAEMLQRQVGRRITSPTEGVQAQVAQVQQDLANNHIEDAAVAEQMAAVESGLDQIAREHLPPIDQQLGQLRKSAEAAAERPTDASQRDAAHAGLQEAEKHQDAVVAGLDDLLERMGKWETYRGIARDVRELADEQNKLAEQTTEVGRETIGKNKDNLAADVQAQLDRLAGRQEQTREQLGRVQRKMEQMSGRLAESDPVGSESLRDAAESSRQAGTSEQMQQAASGIRQNQVGSAETAQRQAAEDLKQMLDTLENNRERDLAKIVQKLREAETKLADIRQRQLEQLKRTQESQANQNAEERKRELERLARQEQELQRETARLAQQLRRLQADQAGKTSSSAAGRMGQAGEQLDQADAEQAQAAQQKVLEELEKAQQEVAQARREAEAQLAMEQLAKIGDTLAALHNREKAAKEESERLEKARQEKGNWTRPLLASLRTAGEAQDAIREDTAKAREVLTSAPVFALALSRAISNMERAGQRLKDRNADPETQAAQQAAVDRLAQLLDSLKNDPANQEGDQQQQQGGEAGGQGSGQPGDGIPAVAQLKLLRSLQIEINERTQELAQLRKRQQKLSPDQLQEAQSLAADQGTLADLVRNFTAPSEDGPPDEGEKP